MKKFCLLQHAGKNRSIKSEKHGPAVRILGFVDSLDEVDTDKYDADVIGEVLLHRTNTWKLISDMGAVVREKETAEHIYRKNQEEHERSKKQIQERIEQMRDANAAPNDDATAPNAVANIVDDGECKTKNDDPHAVDVLPAEFKTHGQAFAAVGVLHDPTPPAEDPSRCIVTFYGSRPTEEECRRFVDDELVKMHPDVDVFVVNMYTWLYTNFVKDRNNFIKTRGAGSFSYNNVDGEESILTRFMKYQMEEEQKCKSFSARNPDNVTTLEATV